MSTQPACNDNFRSLLKCKKNYIFFMSEIVTVICADNVIMHGIQRFPKTRHKMHVQYETNKK